MYINKIYSDKLIFYTFTYSYLYHYMKLDVYVHPLEIKRCIKFLILKSEVPPLLHDSPQLHETYILSLILFTSKKLEELFITFC